MNRRDRRVVRKAGGFGSEPPAGYVRGVQVCAAILSGWRQLKAEPPRFVLPPKEIMLIAPLDQVGHRICRNETARMLFDAILLAVQQGQIDEPPTVTQLRVALEFVGIEPEIVGLHELALRVAGFSGNKPS